MDETTPSEVTATEAEPAPLIGAALIADERASIADLMKVDGVSQPLAERIHAAFRKGA
eukprot:gene12331-12418_t